MEIYLVGGAVRDQLLGLPVKEKDYVVVGSTIDEMLDLGYIQVGKDFPVFLHPDTKEEYALARMERKTGKGYAGFAFDTSASVTLEEDLLRRDLTINAIAQCLDDSSFIDPFNGRDDIKNKILRHVSVAFAEDPVRILRAGRFAARFAYLGFRVADDTICLMRDMVKSGEVDALVPERVWKELEKNLQEKNPEVFFEVLSVCGAMPILFPELGAENISDLAKVAQQNNDPEIRFAALLLKSKNTEIQALCARYRIPNSYKELALLSNQYYPALLNIEVSRADEILNLLNCLDAFRREQRLNKFLTLCNALKNSHNITVLLNDAYTVAKQITIKNVMDKDLKGDAISKAIADERIKTIEKLIETYNARTK